MENETQNNNPQKPMSPAVFVGQVLFLETKIKMKELLEKSGFTKIDGLDRWFIDFQGRIYYVFMDSGKWWVLINQSGIDIKVNQTGFTTFENIRDFFNAVTLGGVVL
jgi:hypothetical protein